VIPASGATLATDYRNAREHEMRWLPARRLLMAGGFTGLTALVIPAMPATATVAPRPAPAASTTLVRDWGRNDMGQLGDGSTASRKLPVQAKIPAGITITSVRSGCRHTLALTSTGKVLAWGDDNGGELGDNVQSLPNSTTPVTVRIPAGVKITAVRAGCAFSLALTSTGTVLAWGFNPSGQLGTGDMNFAGTPVPVKLPPGTKIKGISAGFQHSLAVTTTGQVLAWGENVNGELGDGTTTNQDAPIPVSLPAGNTVTAVAAGDDFSLALTTQGKVWAWGNNADGELGNGTRTPSGNNGSTPVEVSLPTGTKVTSLFAGCTHSVARTAAGKVLAWGDNSGGQLGDGTIRDRLRPVTTRIPKGTKVTAVTAGCNHSLALTAAGKVLAWGNGTMGVLGNGLTIDEERPVTVKLPAGLTATAIAAGSTAQVSTALVRKAKA
jgi:alpha-tubulin suppressor-like RCC1 family protein